MDYQEIALYYYKHPAEIPTNPLHGVPKWFSVSSDGNSIFVKSGKNHINNCTIKGTRTLPEGEFDTMLSFYHRRQKGEAVYAKAKKVTLHQVYWYGIFHDMEM